MKISTVAMAVVGLIISSNAFALSVVSEPVPEQSVKQCVSEIATQANYDNATIVRHVVDSKDWRSIGHKIMIKTSVFGADGTEVLREYTSVCAVTDDAEVQRFKIAEQN